MRRKVNVKITGFQRSVTDEPTVTEAEGTLQSDGSQHYLRYTDADGIRTMIKMKSGHVSVTRSGALSSVMEFIEGDATECVYPTPYGHFDTRIETKTITLSAEGEPFSALITYDLTMNGQSIKDCELHISVK